MHNQIQVFNFEQNEVRTLQVNGTPWFVLKDVCKVLEIANPRNAASRLDGDEKGVRQMDTLGGKQRVTIINESGLYAVILRSDKPQAKQFRKWITADVLPTLRKTGAYSVKRADDNTRAMLAEARARNARAREASLYLKLADRVTVDTYKQVLIAKSAQTLSGEMLLPLPVAEKKTYTAAEIGAMLGVSANTVGRLANRHGLKTEAFGEMVWDKSPYSAHQCQTFRYYIEVLPALKRLIEVA